MSIARFNIFVLIRWMLASVFIVSGFEKLIGPYQNFLFVIQSYDILPSGLEGLGARGLPWFEFFIGVFLLLGLWIKVALGGLLILITVFIGVVAQALLRGLPIEECGCFGELLTLPLPIVGVFDTLLLILAIVLWKQYFWTSHLSLDEYFQKST